MSKHAKKPTAASKPSVMTSVLTSIAGKAIGHFILNLWKEYGPASWLQGWLAA